MKNNWLVSSLLLFFIFLTSVWPFYIDYRILSNLGVNPQRITCFFVVLVFLFMLYSPKVRGKIEFVFSVKNVRMFFILISGYVFWRLFVGFYVSDTLSVFLSINEIFTVYFIFLITVYSAVSSDNAKNRIIKVIFYSYLLVLLFSWLEWALQYNLFSQFASSESKSAIGATVEKLRGGLLRVKGPFENTLTLMQYVVCIFPLSFFYVRNRSSLFKMAFLFFSIGVVFLTFSRIGTLIILMQVFMWKWLDIEKSFDKSMRMLINVLKVFMVISVFMFFVFGGGEDEFGEYELGADVQGGLFSSSERTGQLINGISAIVENPIVGYGLGNAGKVVKDFSDQGHSSYSVYHEVVDNRILSIAIESGVFSAILFLLFWLWLIVKIYKSMLSEISVERYMYGKALFLSISAVFVTFFFLSIFTNYSIIFVVAGLCVLHLMNKNVVRQ
ncbi:O-antigen ligase family protein [Plasticicumulans acidivorans]|uniref:O-antigen ligase n=1 Tax=Plasticicumulans acidivorans TaxID=886464 RepID=A0A317MQ71_9GAMM|nr:O-antigen ligase family protein [Plasticicumulans acidivorans]PWV58443.1 O-antigen ligase [Plasticicumulans acidivorans]